MYFFSSPNKHTFYLVLILTSVSKFHLFALSVIQNKLVLKFTL